MRILLDTSVLIFAAISPERLSKRATVVLENDANLLELSAVSLSEIAIKAALGKLRITAAVARRAVEDLGIRVLPYTADHAFELFDLPLHHGDPFDRQIIAQALSEKIPILTSDEKFSLYKGLKLIW
ncbi:MAG TPA: type II toxin-antitoxin system VapC family toxin [Terriglobales bacterium]|nr:type II toxin-antitoxin system VapC family toxin [Terriglobales bacterium]